MSMFRFLNGNKRHLSTSEAACGRRSSAVAVLGLCCLMLCPGTSVFAASRTVGEFTVDLPAGWKTIEEGAGLLFTSPKDDCSISVMQKDCYNGELDLLAKASASITSGNDLRTLGEGKGVVFADRHARYWVGLLDDKYMEVSVEHKCRGAGPIIKSLKLAPKAKDAAALDKLLALVHSAENAKWLATGDRADDAKAVEPSDPTGEKPNFAALSDGQPAAEAQEKTIPTGWRTTHTGVWAIYDKPEENVWVAVGTYPLKKDPEGKWVASLIELARKLGGINISPGEGMVDFMTREGALGSMQTTDANVIVELYFPEENDGLSELRDALH
ncbi:MAG: hypothetical protein F8N36_06945 [Desulfovibrio sp.]|uniref:hypothetical protein n=1 Tax=Desulfovibrio sp. TaxID=885 RepID=UPI00135EE348|nr:hypothetical protein [Desulfovibrio sp.]MTJ92587.1 hypothetical protein [Desulfovibrio sp.]